MKNKPLTRAQKKALLAYNQDALTAQAKLDQFVAYLRDEHDAPVSDWQLADVNKGFERVQKREDDDV